MERLRERWRDDGHLLHGERADRDAAAKIDEVVLEGARHALEDISTSEAPDGEARGGRTPEGMSPASNDASRDGSDVEMEQ